MHHILSVQFSSGSRQKVLLHIDLYWLIEISDNILLRQRLKSGLQCASKIRADIIFLRTKYLTNQVDVTLNQTRFVCHFCLFIVLLLPWVTVLALSLVNCTKTNTFFIYTQKLHNQPVKIYSNFHKSVIFILL
jgi:hypothetical protein